MRYYIILVILIITATSFEQTSNYPFQKIAPAALRSDFQTLRDSLEKLHPGLYRYKSKTFINHVFDSCYAAIRDSMTTVNFYALTSFAIASFDDGHSNCRL